MKNRGQGEAGGAGLGRVVLFTYNRACHAAYAQQVSAVWMDVHSLRQVAKHHTWAINLGSFDSNIYLSDKERTDSSKINAKK